MSNYVEWSMQGTELINCNCDWGCPCQFNLTPSKGNCRGFGVVQIDKGKFGDLPLDGLRWAVLLEWPSAIHLGNGRLQTIIDERANPKQCQAIEAVSHGKETEPGTVVWQVFSTTMKEFLPTLLKPIELSIDYAGRLAQVKIPGVLEAKAEPLRNPVTGAVHRVDLSIPQGFEFALAQVGNGTAKTDGDAAIRLDLNGSHAHLARIHWSTHGVVR
jgi:hypothetical protein